MSAGGPCFPSVVLVRKGGPGVIVVGIDCHKRTHTAVGLDRATGRVVGEVTVPARDPGHEQLVEWASSIDPERMFALEDCRQVSGRLERHLLVSGEAVVRVPPKLMSGARRSSRSRGKSDPIDAEAVGRAAMRTPDLPLARLEGVDRDVRLLVDHREGLVNERTRVQGRLRWLLHAIDPEISVPLRSLDRYRHLDALQVQLACLAPTVQVRIARSLVSRCRELTREANALEGEISELVRSVVPELLAVPGCGHLTAAKLLGEVAGVSRFPTAAKLALHAGVAPLEASSGDRRRHRLNRTGNRQLNAALHRIAVTQIGKYEPARAYMARRQTEGLTKREALRCLKRHLAKVVYRRLCQAEARRLKEASRATIGPVDSLLPTGRLT
jgi:transposase